MLDTKLLSAGQQDLLLSVRRSIRYHDRRTGFFDNLHRITNALTVLLAGIIFVELFGGKVPCALQWLAGLSAALSIVDFVVGYSERADRHRNLKRQFAELEADIAGSDPNNSAQWNAFVGRRVRIEGKEPPIYRALDLQCQNELLIAEGYSMKEHAEKFSYLNCWQSVTAHFLRWSNIANDPKVVRA